MGSAPSMGARVCKGPPRSLEVGVVHSVPLYRAIHGSIEPAARLSERVYSGRFLGRNCIRWTSLVHKPMLRL